MSAQCLCLKDELLGHSTAFSYRVNTPESWGGTGVSKMLFSTKKNDFFLFQMVYNVKGLPEQKVAFLFLKYFCDKIEPC